ncbi:MAG TPA: hypothetical protein VM684_14550, partial [Gaiellales bacterium]|nr:hypothetical protein [Gaiellales bacterium]
LLEQPLRGRPLTGGAGDPLFEQAAAASLGQPRALDLEALILGRYTSVAELHAGSRRACETHRIEALFRMGLLQDVSA